MTATTRHRNSSTEKSDAPGRDDAPQSQTSASGSDGPRGNPAGSPGRLGVVATAVFYIVLLSATGFTAFQLQQVAQRSREMSAEQEKSAQKYASMVKKMDVVSQEVLLLLLLLKIPILFLNCLGIKVLKFLLTRPLLW